MNLLLGGVGTCMSFFGIFMNLYVIIVLLLNKKARTSSEWILLHLSGCGLGASFFNLCLISPSIFLARWLTSTGSLCSVVGASVLTLQLLTVWSICALSADRCAAIASPLRYTQLVTGRRVAIFFLIIWVLSIGTAMTAFIVSSIKDESDSGFPMMSSSDTSDHSNNIHRLVLNYNNKINNDSNLNDTTIHQNHNHHHPDSILRNSSLRNNNSDIFKYLNGNNNDTKHLLPPASTSLPSSSSSISSLSSTSAAFNFLSNMPSSSSGSTTQNQLSHYGPNPKPASGSSPTVANMISALERGSGSTGSQLDTTNHNYNGARSESEGDNHNRDVNGANASVSGGGGGDNDPYSVHQVGNQSMRKSFPTLEFRRAMGLCLPRLYFTSLPSVLWVSEWIFVILVMPLCTILICDLVVLSIARKQRHRIVMALYQITLSAQATVVRSKGATPPQLWLNRSIPARSRACRAVLEDISSLVIIHLPLILILVFEMIAEDHHAPVLLHVLGSASLFLSPSFTALLYGIRARSLRAAYKSYIRKRMTNTTLQNEIQQRLSPVDGGSPRPSSGAKSFRSCTPSPATSPVQTPRRLSTNDLRPPPMHFPMATGPLLPFPSANMINNNPGKHSNKFQHNNSNHHDDFDFSSEKLNNSCHPNNLNLNDNDDNESSFLSLGKPPRKIRSFLHLPTQNDMQEFWSGLRRPNRSPTIIITHEIRLKDSSNSSYDSKSNGSSPTAEQRL